MFKSNIYHKTCITHGVVLPEISTLYEVLDQNPAVYVYVKLVHWISRIHLLAGHIDWLVTFEYMYNVMNSLTLCHPSWRRDSRTLSAGNCTHGDSRSRTLTIIHLLTSEDDGAAYRCQVQIRQKCRITLTPNRTGLRRNELFKEFLE